MGGENKLSTRQIRGLVVSTIIGVGILSMPNRIAEVNGNDGWIPIILSGLLVVPILMVIDKTFQMYPDKDFFSIGREVMGKWLFNIFLFIFFIYYIIVMSFVVRNLGELVKAFLLETTPIEVLILSFILVTTYVARDNIQVIGRLGYFIYPLILGFTMFLIILVLPETDLTNVLPIFQSDLSKIPRGIEIGFVSYLGYEILLFVLPYSENKKGNLKAALTGLGIVILINLIVFLLNIIQFGVFSLRRLTFPTISLVKEVDLPGYFVENLDGVVMAFWVLAVFATMAPSYFAAGKILSNIFNTKDHSLFILPIAPIVYIVSLYPRNIIIVYEALGRYINYLAIATVIILPILIYFLALIKTRRQNR